MTRYAMITHAFPFEACQSLSGNPGRCGRPHGHSYRLQVTEHCPIRESPGRSDDGMVIDFEDLKRSVEGMILEKIYPDVPHNANSEGGLDQNDLNALTGIRTTAPNLAHGIWD